MATGTDVMVAGAGPAGLAIALFITHATPENAPDLSAMIDRCVIASTGGRLLGVFNCQGELAEEVGTKLLKSDHPEMRMFGEQGDFTRGQPTVSHSVEAYGCI